MTASTPAFSANLGFLFTEHTLPDAVRAAASAGSGAGFGAVECHFPFAFPAADVRAALKETGLPMLGLNTHPGDVAAGAFGLAALPGREADARASINEAIGYAAEIGCRAVHVMAGKTGATALSEDAQDNNAEETFQANLAYACGQAAPHSITILVEPINRHDVPGYHLYSPTRAAKTIAAVGAPNLKMMLDCYHVARMGGDPAETYRRHCDVIGHVQFAGVPHRGDPAQGDIDYAVLLPALRQAGYQGFFGVEYRPGGKTEDSLGWMAKLAEALTD